MPLLFCHKVELESAMGNDARLYCRKKEWQKRSLPAYEEEKPLDRIFMLASDLVRASIILVIIVFSPSETWVSFYK